MGLFSKLFKSKDAEGDVGKNAEPSFYTLTVNARLQPLHRGEHYEDPLDEKLAALGIGSITGGGTLMGEGGEIRNCDVEITLNNGGEAALEALVGAIEALPVPKGSTLCRGGELCRELGDLEGLALYLNGTELPAEVYESSDINEVVRELEARLDTAGRLLSWFEGPQDTVLYFYGTDAAGMKARMEPFLAEYPLCQKCRVEQIA